MSDLLQAAERYANLGLRVIPVHTVVGGRCDCMNSGCKAKGKHPRFSGWPDKATTDLATIRGWWRDMPGSNLGIATGAGTGVWVLDVDGPAAQAALDELQRGNGTLPVTVAAKTARGTHLYFRYPDDRVVGLSKGRLPDKIDVRGNGGQVLAPPSLHPSGVRYEWLHAPGDVAVADAPTWLLDSVTAGRQRTSAAVGAGAVADLSVEPALDLRTHPGVEEGGRHNMAVRLVGAHLGRGENPIDVLDLVSTWDRRNVPPYGADNLKRIVRDLSANDARKAAALTATWPVMGEAGYYGWAGEAVRRIAPQSEADPNAMLVQAMVLAGHSFGPGPHFLIEGTRHGTNLYAVVGDTSDGRKGTGFNRVRGLLPDLHGQLLKGLATGEGLIHQVRDASYAKAKPKKAGRNKTADVPDGADQAAGESDEERIMLEDAGVADKRLLLNESEFKGVFAQGHRDGNILNNVMRDGWDGGILGVMTKNSPLKATDPHISVIGNITRDELLASMSAVDMANGFANRIMWVMSRRSQDVPLGGARVDLGDLQGRLTERMEYARQVGEMRIADDARALYAQEYRAKLNRGRGGKVVAKVTNRAAPMVVRLAMIQALLDRSDTIRTVHLEAALAVWEYCHQSAAYIFGQGAAPVRDQLLDAIRERDRAKSELYRLGNNRTPSGELNAVLAELERDGLIRREVRDTGGRPAEVFVAVGGD